LIFPTILLTEFIAAHPIAIFGQCSFPVKSTGIKESNDMKGNTEYKELKNLLPGISFSANELSASRLDFLAESIGEENFCRLAAQHLVALARPETALPDNLRRFRLLVRDGIVFFLSGISYRRLREAILVQVRLPVECDPGERLLQLARHFPTLNKLGQIIARNPGVDPSLKKWLVRLETGAVFSRPEDILGHIIGQLPEDDTLSKVQLSSNILAEASVAAVVPFSLSEEDGNDESTGVFKVLKKDIGFHLAEELRLLAKAVAYLERDRDRYELQEMMLTDLFAEVRDSMAMEVDLEAERKNLVEASRTYGAVKGVVIPRLLPLRTPCLTAMEYIAGTRITDAELKPDQRQALARRVFQAVICLPLFSTEDSALFHGDPHAGNILAVTGCIPTEPDIALIDWTLAGRLSKAQRAQFMEMMTSIVIGDGLRLRESIDRLCHGSPESVKVEQLLAAASSFQDDPLKTAFHILEEMTMAGMVMPPELILFRKAFFTLEGVLNDLSTDFSMAEAMSDYLGGLVLAELPRRIGLGLLPVPDTAFSYRTLLSNEVLTELSLHRSFALWNKAMTSQFAIFEAQASFSAAILAAMATEPCA
jgi:ubiquinone biosynthesis protein